MKVQTGLEIECVFEPARDRSRSPCQHCGSVERLANGRRSCTNAHRRESRASDPTYQPRANGYQRAHADRLRAAGIRRRVKRRPTAKKEYKAARRERERNAPGFHTEAQLDVIRRAQGGRCAYCRKRCALQRDHMIPLIRGGSSWPWNIQMVCAFHNSSKGELTDFEYRQRSGLRPRKAFDHPYFALMVAALI